MARHIFQGHFKDGNGNVVANGTVSVYVAGGSAATVYSSSSGSAATAITSNTNGYFAFYVDEADYNMNQLFDIKLSKAGMSDQWYYNQPIYRPKFGTTQLTVGSAGAASALPATPSGYIPISIGGTEYIIPYYAKT